MTRSTRILLTAFAFAALAIGVLVYQSTQERGQPPQDTMSITAYMTQFLYHIGRRLVSESRR
ncbi:hypothetical protein J6K59_10615, partial [Leuconostoc mesenteroides]|uniref:hypothetical protein n=1 Tax=Leuconostoc mesenteroides TaxID=1245 RepID=UPI001CBC04DD